MANTTIDMTAEEFFNGLFNLDFMTEEEKQTIYQGAELFAKGKVHQASVQTPSNEKYWRERCEAAEMVIKDQPFTPNAEMYWNYQSSLERWQQLKSTPIPIQTPCGWVDLDEQTMPKKSGEYFGLLNGVEKCFIIIQGGKVVRVKFSNNAQFSDDFRDMTRLSLKILLDATTH